MPSMGFCLSKCLQVGDITRDFEDELDDVNSRSGYQQQNDGGGAAFATTSLLAVHSRFLFSLSARGRARFRLPSMCVRACVCCRL